MGTPPDHIIQNAADILGKVHKWKKKLLSTVKNNHMDYFMLGVFELHVNKAHHNTITYLVVTIKEVMGNLDKDTMDQY
jgi:hypothetical protein